MRIFSLAVAAICAVAATTAHAGIQGSALQTVSGLTIRNVDANRTLTATAEFQGGPPADVRVASATTVATNSAQLSGYTSVEEGGGAIVSDTDAFNPGGVTLQVQDADIAYLGDLATADEPVNDAFADLVDSNGIQSDSSFGGAPVDFQDTPLAGLTSPASATTFANFNIFDPNLAGTAGGDVNNTTETKLVALSTVEIEISFNHLVELSLQDYAPDDQYRGYATTSLTITLTNSSGFNGVNEVFTVSSFDSPDNVFSLNTPVVLDPVTLVAGTTYTLTISQRSEVGFGVVPEPTSMAIFGLMGAGAVVSRRRRRN